MDYRSINIQPEIMSKAVFEITGKTYLPYFTSQVIFHSELVPLLEELHLMIMQEEKDFRKEEVFIFLLEQLIEEYTEQGMPLQKIRTKHGSHLRVFGAELHEEHLFG